MNRLLLIIAASLAAAAVAFFSLHTATPSREPNDDDVIEQLRLAGSNLSKPHPIDFYIYVPSQESANRVAAALSPQGFQTKVEPSASGSVG